MTAQVQHVSFDCADPYRLAQFWSQVTGWPLYHDDQPGDDECAIVPPGNARPWLLFIRVPESKTAKNRLHLDLMPTDRTRDDEVERLLGIGARLVDDQRLPDGRGWAVLHDPEGNEFCVERGAVERDAGQVPLQTAAEHAI
jgi:predicted enzyme related to lactoylglutathione lyase